MNNTNCKVVRNISASSLITGDRITCEEYIMSHLLPKQIHDAKVVDIDTGKELPSLIKHCKECGDLFVSPSGKEKYCKKIHYRPCPVCGKLIEAKYLSDPARCCSGVCKSKLGELNKKVNITQEVMNYIEEDIKLTAELVEAAYEIDPDDARRYIGEPQGGYETEVIDPTDGTIRKRYTGTSIPGNWINGDEYAVRTEHVDKEYVVIATYNYSKNSPALAQYSFTNKKKISNIFKACK